MNNFFKKYLKYKLKYNKLKYKIIGGNIDNYTKDFENKFNNLESDEEKIKFLKEKNLMNTHELLKQHDKIKKIIKTLNYVLGDIRNINSKQSSYYLKTLNEKVNRSNYLKNDKIKSKSKLYVYMLPHKNNTPNNLDDYLYSNDENLDYTNTLNKSNYLNKKFWFNSIYKLKLNNTNISKKIKEQFNSNQFILFKEDERNHFITDLMKSIYNYELEKNNEETYYYNKNNGKNFLLGKYLKIKKKSNICILGDIHGSLNSLLDILKDLQNKNFFINDSDFKLKEDKYIFFLGDIVDYSPLGLECLILALILKNENKNNVYIIKGNHEDEYYISENYSKKKQNIYWELKKQMLGETRHYAKLQSLIPSVIFLNYNSDIYQLCHGGFNRKDTDFIKTFLKIQKEDENIDFKNILIFYDRKNYYHWADFTNSSKNSTDFIKENEKHKKLSRPLLPIDHTEKWLKETNIKCIISGHQDNIPLGLVLKKSFNNLIEDKSLKGLIIDDYKFISPFMNSDLEYNLFTPELILIDKKFTKTNLVIQNKWNEKRINIINKRIKEGKQTINEFIVKLLPGEDFLSLITSTASQSKNTLTNYLILK